jgi:hypothetical protein
VSKPDPKQKLSKITKRKKAAAVAEPAPKGPRQPHLPAPGMAPTIHKNVDEAAEKLGDAKERVVSANRHKAACEEELIRQMRKVNVTHYVNRGLNIEILLETPDRVKLKKYNHRDEEEDNGRD